MSPSTLPARASLSPPLASSPPVFSFKCRPPPGAPVSPAVRRTRLAARCHASPVYFPVPRCFGLPPHLTCAAGGTCFGCGGRAEETAPPALSLISLTQLQASSGEWVSFGLRLRRSLPPSLWVPSPVLRPPILSLFLVLLDSWCPSLFFPPHPLSPFPVQPYLS